MGSTNTRPPNSPLDQALGGIPKKFRDRLINTYLDLKRNCAEGRFDAAGLSCGKFCETAIRFLQERVTGKSTPFGTRIGNFADECRKLVNSPTSAATESERILIPRALVFLYTVRNKRGIGHVGGDVDANALDAAVIARTVDWVICELLRVHHGFSLEEAQALVDGLAIRELPTVWEVAGKKRILRDDLNAKDETLLLLYSSPEFSVMTEDLIAWVEYSNPHVFRSAVLKPLHAARLIEWDRVSETVVLSPKGAKRVEDALLKS